MIVIPFLILAVLILVKLKKGAFPAFLVLVSTKSIIDAFWEIKVGPLSILAFQGILITVLFFEVVSKRKRLPQIWHTTSKIYIIALSLGLFWALPIAPLAAVETIVMNINIYLGFLLIPILVNDRNRLKKFLIAIMICGVFPILVSIYQLQTGVIFQERETVGLTRYVGFYHDAFPTRFYGLFTLFSILVYQTLFKIKKIGFKILIALLAGGAFISIYSVFSKAAVGIIGLWIVFLLIFSKSKIKQSFSIILGLFLIAIIFGSEVLDNVEQLFSKEVGYQTGEVSDSRYTLAGRGYIWQDYWQFWLNEQSVFFQWLGDGLKRPAHNEFLRVLLANGIFGVLFLLAFVMKSIKNIFKIHKNIRVFGMMLFGMYIVDCIGLVPGVYYYYNMLVWGIFGLLLTQQNLFLSPRTH